MKKAVFILFLSIFSGSDICKAQETKGMYKLCNQTGKEIPFSEIKKMIKENCVNLAYTDAEGRDLFVKSFTFVIASKTADNAYFEMVNSNKLSKTIIKRLQKTTPGAMVVISNVTVVKPNGTSALLEGFDFKITQ